MSYFQVLGFIIGLAAMLKIILMLLRPQNATDFIARAYGEKRPLWVIPVFIITLGLVGYTWYMQFTTSVPYSIIVTVFVSLALLKVLFIVFDYPRFKKKVDATLAKEKGREIFIQNIVSGIFGLIVFLFALLVY